MFDNELNVTPSKMSILQSKVYIELSQEPCQLYQSEEESTWRHLVGLKTIKVMPELTFNPEPLFLLIFVLGISLKDQKTKKDKHYVANRILVAFVYMLFLL